MSSQSFPNPKFEVFSLIARGLVLFGIMVVALWFGYTAMSAILLLFGGLILAVLLCGVVDRLQRWTGIPRGLVFGLMLTLLLLGVGLFGYFGVPATISGVKNIAGEVPDALEEFRSSAVGRQLLGAGGQQPLDHLEEAIQKGGVGKAFGTAISVFTGLTSIFLVLVVGIFLAAEPEHYQNGIVNSFPHRHRDNVRKVVNAIGSALWQWLNSQLIAMLLIGIIVTAGMFIIGVEYPITLGILAALLQFIPILGPTLFAIPAVIVVMATSPDKVLPVLILYVVVQAVESNLITPLLLKNAAYLPPVVSLIATVAMGSVFGLSGLILASPITVVFLAIYQRGYREVYLGDSDINVAGQSEAKKKEYDDANDEAAESAGAEGELAEPEESSRDSQ